MEHRVLDDVLREGIRNNAPLVSCGLDVTQNDVCAVINVGWVASEGQPGARAVCAELKPIEHRIRQVKRREASTRCIKLREFARVAHENGWRSSRSGRWCGKERISPSTKEYCVSRRRIGLRRTARSATCSKWRGCVVHRARPAIRRYVPDMRGKIPQMLEEGRHVGPLCERLSCGVDRRILVVGIRPCASRPHSITITVPVHTGVSGRPKPVCGRCRELKRVRVAGRTVDDHVLSKCRKEVELAVYSLGGGSRATQRRAAGSSRRFR